MSTLSMACAICLAIIILVLSPLLTAIYNLTLHPLSRFPGPIIWRSTRLAYMYSLWSGRSHHDFKRLHERFGPVVRVAPNELSFADPAAWKDIYSNHGTGAFPKSAVWHAAQAEQANAIINCMGPDEHARTRKLMEPGFSRSAVKRQESIVHGYVDTLIRRLEGHVRRTDGGDGEATVDIAKWLTFVSLDIVGDLTFGESFGCLEKGGMNSWVDVLFGSLKMHVYVATLRHYRWPTWLLERVAPWRMRDQAKAHWMAVKEKVERRLAEQTPRPDFIALWQKAEKHGGKGLSLDEVYANALIMTFAGSETVATSLAGMMNLLVKCPEKLATLTDEVRTRFDREEALCFEALEGLAYLNAVIWEGFRMCTPFPLGFVRLTPPRGGIVCGHWIPACTFVSINPQALFSDQKRFHDAASFLPERWLPHARTDPKSPFRDDGWGAVKPFSIGPKSCIGKQLALAETRLILARLVWTFDFKQADTAAGRLEWQAQKTFTLVEKEPFDVKLTLADTSVERRGEGEANEG